MLNNLDLPEKCIYFYDKDQWDERPYRSLSECLSDFSEDKISKDNKMVSIRIKLMDPENNYPIPAGTRIGDLYKYRNHAAFRYIYLSEDLSEVYMEIFSLLRGGVTAEISMDYGLIFSNGPYLQAGTKIMSSLYPGEILTIQNSMNWVHTPMTKEEFLNMPYRGADTWMHYFVDDADYIQIPSSTITKIL